MLRATSSSACSSPPCASGAPLLSVPRAHTVSVPPPSTPCPSLVSAITPLTGREHDFSSTPHHLLGVCPDFTCPFAVCPGSGSLSQPLWAIASSRCPLCPLHLTSLQEASWYAASGLPHLNHTSLAMPASLREVLCPAGMNRHRRHQTH